MVYSVLSTFQRTRIQKYRNLVKTARVQKSMLYELINDIRWVFLKIHRHGTHYN